MPGPYVVSNPSLLTTLVGQAAVIAPVDRAAGIGIQCVGLVKVEANAPRTSAWRAGAALATFPPLRPGTAIATFVNGLYPSLPKGNHACLFISFLADKTGFMVLEQHVPPTSTCITKRAIKFGRPGASLADNGDAYSVIL